MQINRYKISVGEITPAHQQQHDILLRDVEGNYWQLLHCLGMDARWRLAGRKFHRWLLFHPNAGFAVRNLAANIPVFLDTLTEN